MLVSAEQNQSLNNIIEQLCAIEGVEREVLDDGRIALEISYNGERRKLVIAGSADIVAKGNAAANSVTFSTASEKIGSHVLVECVYVGTSTLKWLVTNLGATTPTVA